jgi:hypothetical protein
MPDPVRALGPQRASCAEYVVVCLDWVLGMVEVPLLESGDG